MKLAMIGLGRMGSNMARRLTQGGIDVVAYNRTFSVTEQLADETGLEATDSMADAISRLSSPRVVWMMLPAGRITEEYVDGALLHMSEGDILVDGANSWYRDSLRRAEKAKSKGVHYVDAGVSGGIWGLKNGYCIMAGGEEDVLKHIEPVLKALAPGEDRGWAHVGPVGSGHYAKMVHNGVEYGMMQSLAEGFALLKGKDEFDLDIAQIAELWRHGSVVQSWLLDLTAEFLQHDYDLEGVAPVVADSGEGRWTAIESIEQGTPAPVLQMALAMRFASQGKGDYSNELLAMMRKAFGGHTVESDE